MKAFFSSHTLIILAIFLGISTMSGRASAQQNDLDQLRDMVLDAEEFLNHSSTLAAEKASQAITFALSLKKSNEPGLNLRAVSQQEVRAYLILGDAFRKELNDRKAVKYYRQGYNLADAIEDSNLRNLADEKLSSMGKSPEDFNSKLSNFGRQIVEDLEALVEEGKMDEEVKEGAENATLSVLEWQARQAEKRGNYAKAIQLFEQTLPYYLSVQDTLTYRFTCGQIASLYSLLGNASEANRYQGLANPERPSAISAASPASIPDPIEDLKDLVEESEAREVEYVRQKQATERERQTYLEEAEALMRTGNVEQSIASLRRASQMQDRIARLERQRQMDSVENAHFIESQLQEIELLTKQKELQEQKIRATSRTRNFLVLASGLILAIAALITYLFFTKKKAHKTLADTYFQLNKAHEDLKVTQTKLVEAEKMASLGQLTAGIAHEINNPVNFISGNLHPLREDLNDLMEVLALYESTIQSQGLGQQFREVLEKQDQLDLDTVREEIRELMSGIEEGATRTSEIVQGLRTFARMDGGEPQIFDLHQGIDSTLALLKNQLGEIEVIRDFGEIPPIEGYASRINQVFMNLFSNAIQAMPAGGWLRIKTSYDGDGFVNIAVQDTGEGIQEDVRQRIFEPFFTTKDVGKGTGLGLSISLGIVQQHHGNIIIESQLGHGTLVVVRLPDIQPVSA